MLRFLNCGLSMVWLTLLGAGCSRSDPPPSTPNIDTATGEEFRAIRRDAKGFDSPPADNSAKSSQ